MNNLKEQFVTYELALKLKQLGFNEWCLGYYKNTLGDKEEELIINQCNYVVIPEDFYVDAPLWQQSLQWLLKKLEDKYYLMKISLFSDYSGTISGLKDIIINDILFDNQIELLNTLISLLEDDDLYSCL